jgi:hypothetical protein
VEVHVVVSNLVEELEEPITPKLVPLAIPNIGVGAKVTLIDTITHAFEVFGTSNIILKDNLLLKD